MKIYVFGNPLVKKDALLVKLLPELKKTFPRIEFILTDPSDNFPPDGEKELVILDTVIGIKKLTILNLSDLQKITKTPISPHDYDLLFHLLLLKKTKRLNSVKILGVPPRATKDEVLKLLTKEKNC